MRSLSDAEKNHRYYATLTVAIAFLILTIQEGIRLLRLQILNEQILSYEAILFLIFALVTLGDYILAYKWMPRE